ncbi:recombinase family protein [Leptolyngbya sp. GB1-A1]|uniref:fdxN element excision recombinase XisF n=1 Tax=Leptolyngbya sp. GB1-A1 TaxID=2933908 RepID=UPI003299094F
MKHTTIGYARVSKREQSEDSHALEQQQNRLTQAGAEEIFTDVESGRNDDRAQFAKVMELVRAKRVGKVIVTRIDRLGRSLPSLSASLDDFRESGVALQILDGGFDINTLGGKTLANIMGVLAEMESDMVSERSRHGWRYLRQRKVAMNPPFGYRKVNDRHELDREPLLCLLEMKPDAEVIVDGLSRADVARRLIESFLTAKSLRQAIRLFNERYGIQQFSHTRTIAAGFETQGLFQRSPSGLRKWLLNPVLRGHLIYFADDPDRREVHYNTHPDHRLISDDEFTQVERILEMNREQRGFGTRSPIYPLSGLIRCGRCGASCYANKSAPDAQHAQTYLYYYCRAASAGACSQTNYCRVDAIESEVIAALLAKAAAIAEMADVPTGQQSSISPELLQLQEQLAGLERLGFNPALEAAKQDIRIQIEALQRQSSAESEYQSELVELLSAVGDARYWETLEPDEKKSIYRQLVDRVTIQPFPDQPPATKLRPLQWDIQVTLKL